jgi:Gpi18-like mannosyltransferase
MNKFRGLIREYSWPLGVFVVSRVGLAVLTYLSLVLLPLNADLGVDIPRSFPNNLLLDGWSRWDAGWYRQIAENGYSNQPLNDQGQRNVAFFPLYPMSIQALNLLIGNSYISGLLVSNLSFAVALVLLYLMARENHGERVGRWSVVLMATCLFSFYFSAMYTEALFLMLVVAAFYFGEREGWAPAALSAAAASATRTVGVTVAFGICVLYLEKADFQLRKTRWDALWLIFSPLGLIAHVGFLWYRFDAPFLFIKSQYV